MTQGSGRSLIGRDVGSYHVLGLLGAGGMGEVYRARDTRLKRDVALKVLPDTFAQDADRLARFQREAELLASLNHPNIAGVYGLEESDGVRALVMELVEGPTLADRIQMGPIPADDALPIARQIAEALEAAHERGVIHRDLKPANVKLRPDGAVKVLDFGLAKMLQSETTAASVSMSPTLSVHATYAGVILGTAAYMSPEQARGKPLDRRTDVWAFGCVLFEMLTGRRAFDGEDVTEILARIIEREPDLTALPATTPAAIRRLLRRSLQKDRKRRLPDMADARIEIDEALTVPSADADVPGSVRVDVPPAWRRLLPWAVALALAASLLVLWAPWRKAPASTPVRVRAQLDEDGSLAITFGGMWGSAAALSHDGQTLAFVATKNSATAPQLWIRRLDQLQAMPLAGTENAHDPFWSPDGRWVGFFANRRMQKIALSGGAAVPLFDAPEPRGGTWSEDDTIVFTANSNSGASLLRISSAGGTAAPLIPLAQGEVTQRWPQSLPGGRAILFTSHSTTGANYDEANIVVQVLPDGPRTIVQQGGYFGRYVSSGHVIYVHAGTLFAVPFDLERLEVKGQPVPVVQNVASNPVTAGAQVAVSSNGTLVYLGEGALADAPVDWMDRDGKTTPLRARAAPWSNPRFSPDGRRLALEIADGKQAHVWIYEWARDILTRLTFGPASEEKPVWTQDGRRIVFTTNRGKGASNLYWQAADGTGEVQRLTDSPNNQTPASWHPTGKFMAFTENNPRTNFDVMILPMDGDVASGWKAGKPTAFLSSPFDELEPMFSPDGRWLAYVSSESGRQEVSVRPFPGPGGKVQISTDGGVFPTWSRTRLELFYGTTDRRIMLVPYRVEGDAFRPDKPRPWSDGRYGQRPGQPFDLHPDGNRFVVGPDTEATARQDHVTFVFNLFDELRRLAPATRR
jgi:Tol biopolymer transport system component